MRILKEGSADFELLVSEISQRRWTLLDERAAEVDKTIAVYRQEKEQALLRWADEYDELRLREEDLWVDPDWIKSSHKKVDALVRKAIDSAKSRMERFQDELRLSSMRMNDEAGVYWGTEVRPLDRVGIYVPGGRVNHFMTLLLCGIPAREAGVKELIVATPPKKHLEKPYVDFSLLYCAKLLKIESIVLAGSTGGLCALAFGTKYSPPVQKIVGSGGNLSAVAKMRLMGYVGIDTLSGPLETAFVCDSTTDLFRVAADIVARADLDSQAEIYVFHPDREWHEKLIDQIAVMMQGVRSQEEQISIRQCLDQKTYFFQVKSNRESLRHINRMAPSVLCLVVDGAQDLIPLVDSVGTVLLGHNTPPVGLDIFGAPSGLVNTLGTAQFMMSMSPLSFVRRFTILEMDKSALERHEQESLRLAKEEGFTTHVGTFTARAGK